MLSRSASAPRSSVISSSVIDDRGYLTNDSEEIADHFDTTVEEIDGAIRVVQMMDPPGVGARDLQECLVLQLDDLEQNREGTQVSVIRQILTRCWDDPRLPS